MFYTANSPVTTIFSMHELGNLAIYAQNDILTCCLVAFVYINFMHYYSPSITIHLSRFLFSVLNDTPTFTNLRPSAV